MSAKLMGLVLSFGPEDATLCAVLIALSSHANDVGQNCWPSIPTIAKESRRSTRTVMRAIQVLENKSDLWIVVERDHGRGSTYRINVERLELLKARDDAQKSRASTRKSSPQKQTPTSDTVSPVTTHPTSDTSVTSDMVSPVTCATVTSDIDDIPPHPLLGRTFKETKTSTLSLKAFTDPPAREREGGKTFVQVFKGEPLAEPPPLNRKTSPPVGDGDPPTLARMVCAAHPANDHLGQEEVPDGQVVIVLQRIREEAQRGNTTQTAAGLEMLAQVTAHAEAVKPLPDRLPFFPSPEKYFTERGYRKNTEYYTRKGVNNGNNTRAKFERIFRQA